MTCETVLVLGAGASLDFGFPLGVTLTETIISMHAESIDRAIRVPYHEPGKTERFLRRFRDSGQYSIDSFVAMNPEFDLEARTAIAHILLRHEAESHNLFPPNSSSWVRRLLVALTERAKTWDDFDPSWLGIVTFNYDRSLENCLGLMLAASYGRPLTEVYKRMQDKLLIQHVYGSLGTLWEGDEKIEYGQQYKSEDFHHAVRQAASHLRLIPDERNPSSQIESIQDTIRNTHRLCFLGFSYDRTNVLERLGGPSTIASNSPMKKICGTTLKMAEGEIGIARRLLIGGENLANLDLRPYDCDMMLRHTQILRAE